MKTHVKNRAAGILAALAVAASCGTARADLSVSNSTTLTSWNLVDGLIPFYVSITSANLASAVTSQGQPGANSGASYTVLSEIFTITNGAGSLAVGNTNYLLTGIGILGGGGGANISMHIYDITTNFTSTLNNSAATYNFVANGDLLGNGSGLTYSNALPAERQVFFTLSSGPATQDRIVLGANHTYAVEFWTPATAASAFTWYRLPSGTPNDPGGQGMAGKDARLNVARTTITAAGLAGGAPRTLTLALYGTPTSAAPSVNAITNTAAVTNLFIDLFNPQGYGPTNSYVGTNDYAAGQLIEVWTNWFGPAWVTNEWDATQDANGNPNSGSLKITANFNSDQWVVYNHLNGITPPLDGSRFTSLECDIRFDTNSATGVHGSQTIFGHFRIGVRKGYDQDWLGAADVDSTNGNWVHISAPLNAASNTNLYAINDIVMQIDSGYYSLNLTGPSTMWVDNIKLVGPAAFVPPPPPTMGIEKASPGLRIFAGDTGSYSREEIATVNQSASWVDGATYPVTYSVTFKHFPSLTYQGFQFHVFLIPLNYLRYAPYSNSFADYDATNNLWLLIQSGAAGYVGQVAWKTNLPSANPNHVVAAVTNASAIGTWKLTFNSATSGTLAAPDNTAAAFTIPAEVAAEFANPLVAYFGLQPNASAGVGQYVDLSQIVVSNTAGGTVVDNFPADSALDTGAWTVVTPTGQGQNVWFVPATSPYWVTWTLPDFPFSLGASPAVTGPYVVPGYYNGYFSDPLVSKGMGSRKWTLMSPEFLPSNLDPLNVNSFFILSTNTPFNP